MKAKVDEDLCVGTGDCERICPAVFKVVEGVSQVQVGEVPSDAEDACRDAAGSCPTGAISVEE